MSSAPRAPLDIRKLQTTKRNKLRQKLIGLESEPIVFLVRADPKPNYVFPFLDRNGSIMDANPHRPVTANLFEA
jgi:hypothetical protein